MTVQPDYVTINDNNYRNFVNPIVNGERKVCASRGMYSNQRIAGYRGEFEDLAGVELIPRGEWDERIRQMETDQTRLIDYADGQGMRIRDQNGTNYCWAFGTCRSVEYALLTDGNNAHISPASIAAPIKGFKNRGGWGDQAMDWMARKGFNLTDEWPDTHWRTREYYTEDNQSIARTRLLVEYYSLARGRAGWDQLVSCILQGYAVAVGYNWWSHLVCGTFLSVGDHKLGIDNSWGEGWSSGGRGWLSGSRKYADGAVVITAVTPFIVV